MDDWFTLLSHGQRVTATGNSDSHNAVAEAGPPRTYVKVGESANGSMRGLSDEGDDAGIRKGNATSPTARSSK